MELTDIHNRRGNIDTVSQWCKANGYPLLAWPEDAELLTLADLPAFSAFERPNKPRSWRTLEATRYFRAGTSIELRKQIREGFAYARVGPYVNEYAIRSR